MAEQELGLKASFHLTPLELFSDYTILKIKIQTMPENACLRYSVLYRQRMLNCQ